MMEWIKASEELPAEDGYYLIWLTDLCPKIVWYDSNNKKWEINQALKVKAECKYVTHWQRISDPVTEIIVEEESK